MMEIIIVAMDVSKSFVPHDPCHKILRTIRCRRSEENEKRVDKIVSFYKNKYENYRIVEEIWYAKTILKEDGTQERFVSENKEENLFCDCKYEGICVRSSIRYYSIFENEDEKIQHYRRRIAGFRGAITRNINKAKKIRSKYATTLFPQNYKEDQKFCRLIRNIRLNIKRWKDAKRKLELAYE